MKTLPLAALFASLALVALTPSAAAYHAGTPQEYLVNDVCLHESIHEDYAECYGTYSHCENGRGIGVGHTFEYTGSSPDPPYGQEGGWCYVYVVYRLSTISPEARLCVDFESGTHNCVGLS